MHDILPTRSRLFAIHLVNDNQCTHCGEPDTVQHKYVMCDRLREIIQQMMRYMRNIGVAKYNWCTPQLLVQPAFHINNKDQMKKCTWLLGQTIFFIHAHTSEICVEEYSFYVKM